MENTLFYRPGLFVSYPFAFLFIQSIVMFIGFHNCIITYNGRKMVVVSHLFFTKIAGVARLT